MLKRSKKSTKGFRLWDGKAKAHSSISTVCFQSIASTSDATKLRTSSPRTVRLEIFFSLRTLISLPKPKDSSPAPISVQPQSPRSRSHGRQRLPLRRPHLRVHVQRSQPHPLEICRPQWLVSKYPQVSLKVSKDRLETLEDRSRQEILQYRRKLRQRKFLEKVQHFFCQIDNKRLHDRPLTQRQKRQQSRITRLLLFWTSSYSLQITWSIDPRPTKQQLPTSQQLPPQRFLRERRQKVRRGWTVTLIRHLLWPQVAETKL